MKILIVDDEPVSRRILKRLLSRFSGLDTEEAEDGEAAWASLGENPPSLILCDLSMPIMDGTTFIKQLRAHPVFGDIPVIVTSAANDRETLLGVKDLRILDYLLKPFDLVQTFGRLEQHMQPLLARHREQVAAARAAAAKAARLALVPAAAGPALATAATESAAVPASPEAEAKEAEPTKS